ncbi:MAG TPA: ribbon-helix-helix domain-containing protein [Candidatus Thermoplasmatota archaeon]|nr:ribbon-helix-helix domain-containing protein [Candidatus Thermoplasmatota archaeon]
MNDTERVTLRLPVDDLRDLDLLIEAGEFSNRSEAIRRAIKEFVRSRAKDVAAGLEARKELQRSFIELENLKAQVEAQQEQLKRLLTK